MPVDGFLLAEHLETRHGLQVALLNDGRASAWGEYLRGHAKSRDPLLALFFGTGIGIGLMVHGRPYTGAGSAAGEIGHTLHIPGGRRCTCGRLGHYEAYCGGRPMVERAALELGPLPGGGVLQGWPELREKIEAFTREHCTPEVTRELSFVPSLGGSDAILWGAAAATGQLWRD